jgi:hypothetical protein
MGPSLWWWWCVDLFVAVVSFDMRAIPRDLLDNQPASTSADCFPIGMARLPRSQGDGQGGHERAESRWWAEH